MRRLVWLFLVAGALAACGGGGGGGAAVPSTGSGSGPGHPSSGQAKITVVIPKASTVTSSARKRKPQTISPGTTQLDFYVVSVNGASPAPGTASTLVTIATSPYCTATTSGTSCTVPVTLPIATAVVVAVATLDANNNVLGVGQVGPIDTTQPVITPPNVVLGGITSSITISPSANSAPADGKTHTITLTVTAKDASGNVIIAPGAYAAPIALTLQNSSGSGLALSTMAIASPAPNGADTVTLTYDGSQSVGLTQIVATSGNATASTSFAPLVYSPTTLSQLPVGTPVNITVSEAGYSVPFGTVTPSFVTTSCSPASCAPSTPGGTVTISVTASKAGSGSFAVEDRYGSAGVFSVTATTGSGGGTLIGPAYPVYEYPTNMSSGSLYGITVGSSGQSLWFVDANAGTIGEVQSPSSCNGTTCTITELASLPGLQIAPANMRTISTGYDGNMYIASLGNGTTDQGSVIQVNCSDASGSCSSAMQDTSVTQPVDAQLGPHGDIYAPSAYSTMLPTTPPSPGPSHIYSIGLTGFPTSTFGFNVSSFPSAPAYLTLDSSGSEMWFTDAGNGNVGHFSIPCNNLTPCTMYEEPSNTQGLTGFAHRVTPGARRPAGSLGGTPFSKGIAGIVEAADGYLYVAEPGAHQIDRLQASVWLSCSGASCTYTPITLPEKTATPQSLTIGPDGNVWFTDMSGYVGFISVASCATSCKAYEYAVPTSDGAPWGIVAGPDGNIWFTESTTNKIGEVKLQ
ncbi:MAG: hypothetical protein KGN02_05890 [bacterium]|nr:hypothetical protein [bacterium]